VFWLALAAAIGVFFVVCAFLGWIATKLKGGRTVMDRVDESTIRDRLWRDGMS